jgi:predicted N-acetyltransferase YhbS
MPMIRRALATAFQVPIHTIETMYPDDFFVCAAPARMFVARTDAGEVIGTVGHRRQVDAAMLFGLSVRSDQRRREVGSALLSAAMHSAVNDGAALLHGLTCDPTRNIAERLGFRRVGGWRYLVREPSHATA